MVYPKRLWEDLAVSYPIVTGWLAAQFSRLSEEAGHCGCLVHTFAADTSEYAVVCFVRHPWLSWHQSLGIPPKLITKGRSTPGEGARLSPTFSHVSGNMATGSSHLEALREVIMVSRHLRAWKRQPIALTEQSCGCSYGNASNKRSIPSTIFFLPLYVLLGRDSCFSYDIPTFGTHCSGLKQIR